LEDLERYMLAEPAQRDEQVYELLVERLQDFGFFEDIVIDHDVVYEDEAETRRAWSEAAYLDITPDQYAWLAERLTVAEFERLSAEDMHLLLAREYLPFSASAD
jgi:hypothetical protein